ncbi:hypothetical protein BASA50_004652 [Batrachochytrium salamandrivorans]|uniref:Uncharacterized protein n=1 Tax=Batrachochytrium salamandrivorans TaxID=1357716 RepID=A0ABQ8FF01_9FUNG|nr:hypothetical protein BASA50_004652 [Batrachochytrium salamandrivorans]
MQFFHLFSFVVVASYAVALPQPAKLSEKYSNNVDTTLASGLKARSYQPESNSQKDLATLMLLKRQDDSEGSSEDNSEGSGTPPPPDTTPDDSEKSPEEDSESGTPPPSDTIPDETDDSGPFTKDDVSTENLAYTIENVGDGNADLYPKGEIAGRVVGGTIGPMIAEYFRKSTYVTVALRKWVHGSVHGIFLTIRSGLGDEEYSKVGPDLTDAYKEWEDGFKEEYDRVSAAMSRILKDADAALDDFQRIHGSVELAFEGYHTLIGKLIPLLGSLKMVRLSGGTCLI